MRPRPLAASLILASIASIATGQESKTAPPTRDVVFARTQGGDLKLDLHLPTDADHPPLVIFIHGGGWRKFTYKRCLTPWLTEYGYAVASIDYRLTDKAAFPAQIHDVKAAVRWLRAHADTYGYDATRIGVAGSSAGGHLATLLGVTHGNRELEGDVGDHDDQSSRVDAIVDYFGPMDFILRSRNQPQKTEKPGSPVHDLLGGPASKNPDLARLASPAFHVSADDPPLLVIHGEKDTTVKPDQARRICEEYRKLHLDVTFIPVPDAGHGGKVHFEEPYRSKVVEFLDKHLKAKPRSEK